MSARCRATELLRANRRTRYQLIAMSSVVSMVPGCEAACGEHEAWWLVEKGGGGP